MKNVLSSVKQYRTGIYFGIFTIVDVRYRQNMYENSGMDRLMPVLKTDFPNNGYITVTREQIPV